MRRLILYFALLLSLMSDFARPGADRHEVESQQANNATPRGTPGTNADPAEERQRSSDAVNNASDIVALYQSLSQLPLRDQRNQLRSLSPQTKAALWTYNIERYLDMHPALDTEAQNFLREVIRAAANPGFFQVETSSSSYDAHQAILAEYMRRTESVLPAGAIYEVLIRLGPEPRVVKPMKQDEIVALYQSLSQLPLRDQRNQLRSFSPQTKAALWTYNIERYLDMHPALDTEAQNFLREVIRAAASPGFFEVEKGSPSYVAHQATLAEYMRRAESVLPAGAIYEVLIRLGPEPRMVKPTAPE